MPTAPRNVLFLIADDWSPLAGCYNSPIIQTPHIDAFAETAVTFDHAFCTTPSCAASRANIMTGQYSHTHGQYGHCHFPHGFRTHENMPSLPSVLGDAGYATGLIGKAHIAPASVYPFGFQPEVHPHEITDMVDHARDFLAQNAAQPFYLHVGFTAPHRMGDGFGNELPCRGVPVVEYDPAAIPVPDFLPDLPAVREDLADYYQAISRFDYGIGEMLRVLAESGRADDTLVIVTADHGMPFPGAKASFFDSGHHCPFLLRAPGKAEAGQRNAALMNWSHIAPTLYDWCAVTPPPDLPERSLLPILNTPEPTDWEQTFFAHSFHEINNYNPYRVLRERRLKYAQHLAFKSTMIFPTDLYRSKTWQAVLAAECEMLGQRATESILHRAPEELYDIIADPMETKNLILEPQYAADVTRMRAALYAFREKTKDIWLEVDYQENRPDNPYAKSP